VLLLRAHAAKDSTIAWILGCQAGLQPAAGRRDQASSSTGHGRSGLGQLDKSGVAELTFKGRHA
jgi:3-hydroxyisobutyrate dehydrogenase